MTRGVRTRLFAASIALILVVGLVSTLLLRREVATTVDARLESELIRAARVARLAVESAPHLDDDAAGVLAEQLATATGARVEVCRERSYQTEELFVSTTDPGYSQTGTWTPSTATPGYYGSEYRYAQASAAVSATARFAFTAPASGRYPVYVRYGRGPNRNAAARHRVAHAGGVSEVIVDQQAWGLGWTFLGEFYFVGDTFEITVAELGVVIEVTVIAA